MPRRLRPSLRSRTPRLRARQDPHRPRPRPDARSSSRQSSCPRPRRQSVPRHMCSCLPCTPSPRTCQTEGAPKERS
jgi:hypothetical protein